MSSIFIPGRGSVSFGEARIDAAVKDYDSRLFFDRNKDTGDWCVFIRLPRPREPFPVMGFGSVLPDVNMVMDRVREADTMRNGNKIYDEVVASQKAYKDRLEYSASQASEESSEVVEHFLRRHGKSPVIKSLSKGVSNNDVD